MIEFEYRFSWASHNVISTWNRNDDSRPKTTPLASLSIGSTESYSTELDIFLSLILITFNNSISDTVFFCLSFNYLLNSAVFFHWIEMYLKEKRFLINQEFLNVTQSQCQSNQLGKNNKTMYHWFGSDSLHFSRGIHSPLSAFFVFPNRNNIHLTKFHNWKSGTAMIIMTMNILRFQTEYNNNIKRENRWKEPYQKVLRSSFFFVSFMSLAQNTTQKKKTTRTQIRNLIFVFILLLSILFIFQFLWSFAMSFVVRLKTRIASVNSNFNFTTC